LINFISTFPPLMCGIGTYTSYLVNKMNDKKWKVFSFKPEEFLKTEGLIPYKDKVLYEISIRNPHLNQYLKDDLVWFQHSFGMWGNDSSVLLSMVKEAKHKKNKVIVSFHTIHFESKETESGMSLMEEKLLDNILPWIDLATVFTDGAYWAIIRKFSQYKDKIVVLRHGVHSHRYMSKEDARERLLRHLIDRAEIPATTKKGLKSLSPQLFSDNTILMGNFGFITPDKDPLQLYQISKLLQDKFPSKKVITIFIGKIQKRNDRKIREVYPILENLKAIHDGTSNIFIEDFLPEEIFPSAFSALDFSIFWCQNATQSGRMAHAQGTGTCVVGRRIEGMGETLDLSGLPAGVNINDLAEKIAGLILDPKVKEDAEKASRYYAQQFSFENQAKKHLLLEEVVRSGKEIPSLDRSKPDFTFILPDIAIGRWNGLEEPPKEIDFFLNVADDIKLYPPPKNYYKIPFKDGVTPQVKKLREAIKFIDRCSKKGKILVFCRYGKGRSASAVIAYLCNIGYDYDEAVKLVARKRAGINPLPGLYRIISTALKKKSPYREKHVDAYPLMHSSWNAHNGTQALRASHQ